jgi:hypothetical protein
MNLPLSQFSILRTRMRYFCMLPFALVASCLVFTILSGVSSPEVINRSVKHAGVNLNFFVEKNSRLQLRERHKPNEPVPPEQPPIDLAFPRPSPTKDLFIDAPKISSAMPALVMNMDIRIANNLSDIGISDLGASSIGIDVPFQANLIATKDIPPQYPSRALRKKIEGVVVAEFIVGADGVVQRESIEFVEVNPEGVFETAVIRSLNRSKFQRFEIGGTFTAYKARKTYQFQIPK